MKQTLLYFIVFISGAAVLMIEILGTRILGPFYGVSIFLWSALITTTLISLSIGYVLGGRWADKGAKLSNLCWVIGIAGIWMLIIPFYKKQLLLSLETLGLRTAVLTASFLFFTIPLTLLGMVSPYIIKFRAQDFSEIGKTAGDIYAISTIGSVIGALITGFFLIPTFGINILTITIGLLLMVAAFTGILQERNNKLSLFVLLLILAAGLSAFIYTPVETAHPNKGLIDVEQSPYGEIRVADIDGERYLLIDGGVHAVVDNTNFQSVFPYVAVMDLTKYLFDVSGDALVIGLGGGSIVKNFSDDGWSVDAVEIDKTVINTAVKYFGFKFDMAKVFNTDGRRYLLAHNKKYDVIILDAFGSSSIPFHLITEESFKLAASRLRNNGVLAVNILSIGWNDLIVRSVAATLKKVFNNVAALPIVEPPNLLGNVVLLASNRRIELNCVLERNYNNPDYRFSADYERAHAWDNKFIPNIKDVPVLTDDLNPVSIWSERINIEERKSLHTFFGRAGIDW